MSYRDAAPAPAEAKKPTLLATVPPMDWVEGEAVFGPDSIDVPITIQPAPQFPYFEPRALWAEPLDGLRIVRFHIGGCLWTCRGDIPLELFRLAMIDLSDMPIMSSLALGMPAFASVMGSVAEPVTVRVLVGGKNIEHRPGVRL